jgi:hypothetical protein
MRSVLARRASRAMRILFATPEVSDFVQVGGLGAVSAALPRALQGLADIRLVIPGDSEVLAGLVDLTILGGFPAFAELLTFEVGFGRAADGLPYYVVVCPGLFERAGSPYGDKRGIDWSDNDAADERYWREVIAPMVAAHQNVEFIGEINESQKAQFLGNARALLFAIGPSHLAWS